MSLFKIPGMSDSDAESPVLLFRDLKRDPNIKFLWGHQEKTLDAYFENHLTAKDLAIELPTGTGKTLVGLLIGEYRRRSWEERVAFLCSTRQLCAQVHKQAKKYGIPSSLLIGKQADYDPGQFFSYQQGKSIAITTYSGIFNTNPRISDPNVIICDDAHAAENFIPDMWTLRISKHDHADLFHRLFKLLRGLMSENGAYRIESDLNPNHAAVEMISPIALDDIRTQFVDAVNGFLEVYSDLAFQWKMVGSHFSACNLYCSATEFELRPILAPTQMHAPFSGCRQRIYMSATLGDDGDLERCFGVRNITRLPAPDGWDRRGTGRRLILFPQLSKNTDDDGISVLDGLLKATERTLILVPNNRVRDKFRDALSGRVAVYVGADSEENIEGFRRHSGAATLILANRYDGIDFPGEECRVVVVCGFPVGAGLQEVFLTQRLKAFSITQDRVRTRVTQAMGRCTRDESDFSVVLMLGGDLVKWFCTTENVAGMHPELQAEVHFGLENSTDGDSSHFLALIHAFLSRSSEWDAGEAYIKSDRSKRVKRPDPSAAALQRSVDHEIDFIYALWNGAYEKAYEHADAVLAQLSGGDALRAYRCFWLHQAAVAAHLAWKQSKKEAYKGLSIERLTSASKGNFGIAWLSSLASKLEGTGTLSDPLQATDEWFEALEKLLGELGLAGSKFDRVMAEKKRFIESTTAKQFHQGLNFLGRMLGAITHEWEENAKPDGFWNLGYARGFVFEAKTNQTQQGVIGIDTVRQALTHEKCVMDDRLIPQHVSLQTVVISPRTVIDEEARRHSDSLFYSSHDEIVSLFERASSALTELRVLASQTPQEDLPDVAFKVYSKFQISPANVVVALSSMKLSNLPLG